jgi:hypothetical protein
LRSLWLISDAIENEAKQMKEKNDDQLTEEMQMKNIVKNEILRLRKNMKFRKSKEKTFQKEMEVKICEELYLSPNLEHKMSKDVAKFVSKLFKFVNKN